MPIEFAPPQPNLQGFNIPPVQYTDPLETLARMQQLKTQGLQQQTAQLGLQQAQMQMASNRAMLDAFVKGGGDPDKTEQLMRNSGQVLPDAIIGFKNHILDYQTKTANLRKDQQQILKDDTDRYAGYLEGVTDQDSLNAANAKAKQAGIGDNVQRLTVWPGDAAHVKAFSNSLLGQSALLDRQLKGQQVEKETEAVKTEKLQGQIKGQEAAKGEVEATVRDIQAAETDPKTGTPTPQAWAQLRVTHPNLPPTPSTDYIAKLTRSAVPTKDQPEYDINQMKARLGLMGNDKFDQFMMQYARSLNKTPSTLAPAEFMGGLGRYAELTADPVLRSIAIGQKGLQEQLTRAQVASLPSPEAIEGFARDLLNLDMAPSQFSELRSGRVSWGPQVIQRAREIAQAEGKPFSMAALDAKFKTWEDTEKKFATGPEAQMARSFDNLMQHTGLMEEARKALNKSDLPALKAIAGYLGVQSGGTAETVYDTIADFVSSEAGKAFLPSGGGEAERAKVHSHFERNLGDEQISKNIRALMHLADSQRQGLENQYERGTFGKGQQKGQLFSSEALATRDRLMGKAPGAGDQHVIKVGNKRYRYNGSGDTSDLKNYTELPQ